MKKPFLGLRTAIYHVPDINEAKEWYTKAFDTPPYFDEPFYVGFNIGGFELGLLPTTHKPETPQPESVVAYWGVEDAQAQFERLLSLGATAQENPTDVGEGILVASARDPWGNIIGIIYNPVFKIG